MITEAATNRNKAVVFIFIALASIVTLVALLTSSYSPWGIFWEGRGLLVAFAGCVIGIAVSISIPGYPRNFGLRTLIPDILQLGGVTIFWALMVAAFNSNQTPAENPFDVPVWAELYQIILLVSCAIAWFWWHRSRDVLLPGLLLVILAATADGMLFNHYLLSSTYLFLAMAAVWTGIIWLRLGLPSFRNLLMVGGLGFIAITFIASIQGASFGDSLNFIWRLLSGWFIAIGIVSLRIDEKRHIPLLFVLLSAGILITILTLIRYIYLIPIIGLGNSLTFRLSVAKADSNALGAAMIMPFALLLFLRNHFPPKFKFTVWVLLVLMLIPVFLSLSKSLWMGMGLMVILGLILSGKNWKRYLLFLLIVVVIVSLLAVVFPVIRDRMFSEYSVSFRQLIYQTVFRCIFAHPILGWGPYNTFIHATYAANLPYESVYLDRYYLTSHTHSIWLELAEGTGFIGLLCFIGLIILIFRKVSTKQNWVIAALAGLLLTLTFMGGLSSFNLIPYDLWILLALISRRSRRPLPWFGGILIAAFIVGSLGMSGEWLKRKAETEVTKGNLEQARQSIAQARLCNPFSLDYPAQEAKIHILADDFPAAIKCYDRCVELAPLHPIWRSRRGVSRLVTGDYDGAITDLTIATKSDKWGVTGMGDLHAPLAAALATAGVNNSASRNLGITASIFPEFPTSPWAALIATQNGLTCGLCPDFSTAGSDFERYLRCKHWLLNSAFPSTGTFRSLYPYDDSVVLYTTVIFTQLQQQDIPDDIDYKTGLHSYFTLGSSYYAARKAEGMLGKDFASLYGSYSKIPAHFLRLLNSEWSSSTISSFYHVFNNLGLALYAYQTGRWDLMQNLLQKATERGILVNPRQFEFYDQETLDLFLTFHSETRDSLPEELISQLEERAYSAAKSSFRKLIYLYITSDSGYDKAEELASLLFRYPSISNVAMTEVNAAFGPHPLLAMIDAYLHRLKGDNNKAMDAFVLACALAPHNRLVQQYSIKGMIDIGKIDKAVEYTTGYLADEPYDIDGLDNLARKLATVNRIELSEKILQHLYETFPYSDQPSLLGAYLAKQQKRPELEFAALTKAVELSPNNMGAIIAVINFDLAQGNMADAQKYIERGLEINPANLSLWMSRVALAESNNQPAQALEYARFAHNIDETNSWVTTTLAAQLVNANQPNEALQVINTALKNDPNDTNALYWRAKIYESLGKKAEALADYERLIKSKNAPMNIYVEVATLRLEQNHTQDALSLMQEATELYPNDPWGWATYGDIARRLKKYDLARTALDRAIALSPDNESYRTLRRDVEKIPLAELITDCEKMLAAGNKPGALAQAEAAVQQYPGESWAWANLAYMANQAGNKPRARTAIAKAIELAPDNQTWQKLRQDIEK
jgi:tetratricopeptide (TPR) repeat protein/O-antigen ligase